MSITIKQSTLKVNQWQAEIKSYVKYQKDLMKNISQKTFSKQIKIDLMKGLKQVLKIKFNQILEQKSQFEKRSTNSKESALIFVSEKSHLVLSGKCLQKVDKTQMNLLNDLQELIAKKGKIKSQKQMERKSQVKQKCKNKLFESVFIPNAKMVSSIIINPQASVVPNMSKKQDDTKIPKVNINRSMQVKPKVQNKKFQQNQFSQVFHNILKESKQIRASFKEIIQILKSGYKKQIELNLWIKEIKLNPLDKKIEIISLLLQKQMKEENSNQKNSSQTTISPNQKQTRNIYFQKNLPIKNLNQVQCENPNVPFNQCQSPQRVSVSKKTSYQFENKVNQGVILSSSSDDQSPLKQSRNARILTNSIYDIDRKVSQNGSVQGSLHFSNVLSGKFSNTHSRKFDEIKQPQKSYSKIQSNSNQFSNKSRSQKNDNFSINNMGKTQIEDKNSSKFSNFKESHENCNIKQSRMKQSRAMVVENVIPEEEQFKMKKVNDNGKNQMECFSSDSSDSYYPSRYNQPQVTRIFNNFKPAEQNNSGVKRQPLLQNINLLNRSRYNRNQESMKFSNTSNSNNQIRSFSKTTNNIFKNQDTVSLGQSRSAFLAQNKENQSICNNSNLGQNQSKNNSSNNIFESSLKKSTKNVSAQVNESQNESSGSKNFLDQINRKTSTNNFNPFNPSFINKNETKQNKFVKNQPINPFQFPNQTFNTGNKNSLQSNSANNNPFTFCKPQQNRNTQTNMNSSQSFSKSPSNPFMTRPVNASNPFICQNNQIQSTNVFKNQQNVSNFVKMKSENERNDQKYFYY